MPEHALAIFDDGQGRWGPMTDRRPVFDLRSGAVTNRQRIERILGMGEAAAVFVSSHLAEVVAERDPQVTVNPESVKPGRRWLLVNGRWNGVDSALADDIRALPEATALLHSDGSLVAAHLDGERLEAVVEGGYFSLSEGIVQHRRDAPALLRRPWDILNNLSGTLMSDLVASDLPQVQDAPPPGTHVLGDHVVRIAADATVLPPAVFNSQGGPIVVDRGARIEPFAALEGPCYVGQASHLAAHTALRAGTTIGPHCKVGGELKHVVIHSHSNKAHLGYLGDSLVGEWVNLGANTNVSNLKNTYGGVRVQLEPGEPMEDTGRCTHGPIIGDFVRTAIGSRLLTGSVLGTGCMLAISDLAPKHAKRFTFRTDAGVTAHDIDALLTTARHMMALHGMTLSEAEAALLVRLHVQATGRVA